MDIYTKLVITCILMITGRLIGDPKLQNLITSEINVKDFGAIGDGITDDSLAVNKAWDLACSLTGQFNFPAGNFVVAPITFSGPCKAKTVVVNVTGDITAPLMKDWPKNVNTWINFQDIDNLVITGRGHFNGQGTAWWTSCRKTKTCMKNPTALGFHACKGLKLLGVTSDDSPRNHISVNDCNGAVITNINLNAPGDSPNTDGIDISNTKGVQINGGHIGTGDDCIAINGGSFNINIKNVMCGPGHGISVGSLGRNGAKDVVSNIMVVGCTFTGTQNGVRIKTEPGGSGSASLITFSKITVKSVQHPIILSQFYCPGGDPNKCKDMSHAVQISGVKFIDIKGTSSSADAINIRCSANPGSCGGVTLDQINIQPVNPSFKVSSTCQNTQVRVIGQVFPPVVCTQQSLIEMLLDYSYGAKTPKGIASTR